MIYYISGAVLLMEIAILRSIAKTGRELKKEVARAIQRALFHDRQIKRGAVGSDRSVS